MKHKHCYKQAENEKQTFLEWLYWVVFQFFIQKYYTWQKIPFDAALVQKKKHDAGGLRWMKY